MSVCPHCGETDPCSWRRQVGGETSDVSRIAEDFGGEVRLADSTINNIGGHDLHVEGGADLMWRQVAHLTMALREMCAEIDRLRAYTCPDCGRPGVTVMRQGDDSPFLQYVLANGATDG